jgi:hypothetical protein
VKEAVKPVPERIEAGVPAKKRGCCGIMNYGYFMALMPRPGPV